LHNLRAEFGEITVAGEITKVVCALTLPISSFAPVVEEVNAAVR
jgi:hypothetical protein